MSAIYVILLSAPSEEISKRMEAHYPGDKHFRVSDSWFLTVTNQKVEEVAKRLGLDDRDNHEGVVFKLNSSYSGAFDQSLWDWIDKSDGRAA